jgi:hypothetical protein
LELSGTAKKASSSPISSDVVRQNRTDLQHSLPGVTKVAAGGGLSY